MRHFKSDISISQLTTVFVEWIGIKTLVRIVRNVEKAVIFRKFVMIASLLRV